VEPAGGTPDMLFARIFSSICGDGPDGKGQAEEKMREKTGATVSGALRGNNSTPARE
jgi:hypothetical protein